MARKPDAAKAKAAKQKKILIVLSGVLLLALVYAFMTVRGLNKGGSASAAPPPAATTTTTATPAAPAATPAPGTSAAPALAATSSPTSASTAPGSTAVPLVAATKPAAGTGQLESFSRFASKDPFDASGPKDGGSGAGSSSGGGSSTAPSSSSPGSGSLSTGNGSTGAPAPAGGTSTVLPPQPPPSSAVIAINGISSLVATGADFPTSPDPVENGIFHLLSLTQTTAQVTVVGGSYASGSPTLTLKVNQPVTLVNTADGKRYTLQLFPQGTAPPAGTSAASTSATTAP